MEIFPTSKEKKRERKKKIEAKKKKGKKRRKAKERKIDYFIKKCHFFENWE